MWLPSSLRVGARAAPISRLQLTLGAGLRFHATVVLLYVIGALYLLAHVLPAFGSAIPGAGVAEADGWQNTWNLWWVRRALASGQNPYWTDMLFFPTGTSLYLHTLNITNALVTMPVQLLAGPVAAYNTAVFLGLVLTGLATYLLALRLIGQRVVAAIVGALFTFSPFHLSKIWDGHLSWVTLHWIPFYLLALLAALDTGRRRHAVIAGVLLGLATLTSWYYAIFSALFTALLAAVRAPAALGNGSWRRQALTLLVVGAMACVVTAPVLLPTLAEYRSGDLPPPRYAPDEQMPGWDGETGIYSADLLDIFFPSFLHPVWGDWSRHSHAAMRQVWFWTITPGIGVLILALIGSVLRRRQVQPLVVLVGVLFVLMLGPRLRVAGIHTGLVLPYDLLQVVPGMTLAHRPNHLAIYMLPLLMVLAGWGMLALWERGRGGQVAVGLLGALVAVEYAVLPLPTLAAPAHPQVAALAGQSGAVLDLPPDERTSGPMNHQMAHGRPIVGGYLARQPDEPPFTRQLPPLRELWQLYPESDNGADIVAQHPDDGQQALRFYNITTILVRRSELEPFQDRDAARVIDAVLPGLAPAYRDNTLSVYQVPPTRPEPFLYLGRGWLPREQEGGRVWRWMGEAATLRLVNPDSRARWVTLQLDMQSYAVERPLSVELGTTLLGSFTVRPAQETLRLALALPPGEHILTLRGAPSQEDGPTGRRLSFSFSRIALVR